MKSANCKSGDRRHISVESQIFRCEHETNRRQPIPTAVSLHRVIPAVRSPVVFRYCGDERLGQGLSLHNPKWFMVRSSRKKTRMDEEWRVNDKLIGKCEELKNPRTYPTYRLLTTRDSRLATVLRLSGGTFSPYFQISQGNLCARHRRGMNRRGCENNRTSQPR